jgi:hypothetical protein
MQPVNVSYLLDWKLLGKFYFKARRQALQQVYGIEILHLPYDSICWI